MDHLADTSDKENVDTDTALKPVEVKTDKAAKVRSVKAEHLLKIPLIMKRKSQVSICMK